MTHTCEINRKDKMFKIRRCETNFLWISDELSRFMFDTHFLTLDNPYSLISISVCIVGPHKNWPSLTQRDTTRLVSLTYLALPSAHALWMRVSESWSLPHLSSSLFRNRARNAGVIVERSMREVFSFHRQLTWNRCRCLPYPTRLE